MCAAPPSQKRSKFSRVTLWSANDQMQAVVAHFGREAADAKLKDSLQKVAKGIADHTGKLKSLLEAAGGGDSGHCVAWMD